MGCAVVGFVLFLVLCAFNEDDEDDGGGGSSSGSEEWEKKGELYTHTIRKYDVYRKKDD